MKTSTHPTIDRGIVTSIVASIEALHADVEELMEESGLDQFWMTPEVNVLPEAHVWKLFELGARSLDMPDLGLRVGSNFQIRKLGSFGRRLESSLTAFSCLTEYINTVNRFSSHSKFWLETHDGGAWFCRRGIDLIDVGRGEVEQFAIELMIRLVQLACGPTWMPAEIIIQRNTDRCFRDLSTYDDVQIRCGQQSTAIWISTREMLSVVAWQDDAIIEQIRAHIKLGRDDTTPTLASTARQLGFSVRTLQRELSLQGLDWSRLLEQVRLNHAARLLTTEDVAFRNRPRLGLHRSSELWPGVPTLDRSNTEVLSKIGRSLYAPLGRAQKLSGASQQVRITKTKASTRLGVLGGQSPVPAVPSLSDAPSSTGSKGRTRSDTLQGAS